MKSYILAIIVIIASAISAVYGYNIQKLNSPTVSRQLDEPAVSKEAGISVIFPDGFDKSRFIFKKGTRRLASGETSVVYLYVYFGDHGRFMISYTDLTDKELQPDETKKRLTSKPTGLSKNDSLDSDTQLKVSGFQARAFSMHYNDEGEIVYQRTVTFAANQRLYYFTYLTYDKRDLLNSEAKKFFSSIHVLNSKNAR